MKRGSNPRTGAIVIVVELNLFNAPVTELVYVLVLEAKFWEFESPLGHQVIE